VAQQLRERVDKWDYVKLKSSLSCSVWAHPRNLIGGDGRCRKDKRQKTKHAQSWGQVGCALRWRHTTVPLHLQQVYYMQWQNEVEQQFLEEVAWHCNSLKEEEPVSLNVNIFGKIAVLHLAHLCGWAWSLFDTALLMYSTLYTSHFFIS
jgi:hypothetical protein